MEHCYLLWTIELPSGDCADWFSGTFSALAVCVALAGYFITSRHLARADRQSNTENLAGISLALNRVIEEVHAAVDIVRTATGVILLGGERISIISELNAVKFVPLSTVTQSQARFLLASGKYELCSSISNLISNTNQMNMIFEDYSNNRRAFSQIYTEAYKRQDSKSTQILISRGEAVEKDSNHIKPVE